MSDPIQQGKDRISPDGTRHQTWYQGEDRFSHDLHPDGSIDGRHFAKNRGYGNSDPVNVDDLFDSGLSSLLNQGDW